MPRDRSAYLPIKRMMDLVLSIISLPIVLPVLLLASIAIRLDTRGPAFFIQERIGQHGRHFRLYKLRTMVANAEELKASVLDSRTVHFKTLADPRITRVGRFLRRTSIDELPQLWNVLRGEMSLVGPRTLPLDEDTQIEGWRRRRLDLSPGITGMWQVHGSWRIPMGEMVKIDYLYVANWSLWTDVKILLRTVPYVLRGKGQ